MDLAQYWLDAALLDAAEVQAQAAVAAVGEAQKALWVALASVLINGFVVWTAVWAPIYERRQSEREKLADLRDHDRTTRAVIDRALLDIIDGYDSVLHQGRRLVSAGVVEVDALKHSFSRVRTAMNAVKLRSDDKATSVDTIYDTAQAIEFCERFLDRAKPFTVDENDFVHLKRIRMDETRLKALIEVSDELWSDFRGVSELLAKHSIEHTKPDFARAMVEMTQEGLPDFRESIARAERGLWADPADDGREGA